MVFGLGMTIGLVSVVNTFLHIRTPFLISLPAYRLGRCSVCSSASRSYCSPGSFTALCAISAGGEACITFSFPAITAFDNIGDESILRTLVTSLRERVRTVADGPLRTIPPLRAKIRCGGGGRMSPLAIARGRCGAAIMCSSRAAAAAAGRDEQQEPALLPCHHPLRAAAGQEGVPSIRRASARSRRTRTAAPRLARSGVRTASWCVTALGGAARGDRRSGGAGRHHGGPGHPHEKDGQGGGETILLRRAA